MAKQGRLQKGNGVKKGIIYFSDNLPQERFLKHFRIHLKIVSQGIEIVWVTQKPINERNNIVFDYLPRHHKSICFQILAGIRHIKCDVLYFAEHDVLYHPSHFEFVPERNDTFYYNTNRWWLRVSDGLTSHKDNTRSLSNLVCCYDLANDFFTRRMFLYESGIRTKAREEPGKHKVKELPDYKCEMVSSEWPNVDVRHNYNYTKSDRFKKDNPAYIISDKIPGWNLNEGIFTLILKGV